MGTAGWLLLTDYSSKYRVSVSTLRRRIKSEQIQYRFDNGKYFILDAPPPKSIEASGMDDPQQSLIDPQENQQLVQGPSMPVNQPVMNLPSAAATLLPIRESSSVEREKPHVSAGESDAVKKSDSYQATATVLINELKRAYTNVLQEKEEHIIQLKEEVTDLKTLVRVLEQDNARLRDYFSQRRHL
jgi:hypothetical protein